MAYLEHLHWSCFSFEYVQLGLSAYLLNICFFISWDVPLSFFKLQVRLGLNVLVFSVRLMMIVLHVICFEDFGILFYWNMNYWILEATSDLFWIFSSPFCLHTTISKYITRWILLTEARDVGIDTQNIFRCYWNRMLKFPSIKFLWRIFLILGDAS